MTLQELFDRVAVHLLTQRKKALCHRPNRGGMGCCYRTSDGLKCAVGCLISDEDYNPYLEGFSVMNFDVAAAADILDVPGAQLLASQLQGVHDTYEPETWHNALRRIAERWHLGANVLSTLAPITQEELEHGH